MHVTRATVTTHQYLHYRSLAYITLTCVMESKLSALKTRSYASMSSIYSSGLIISAAAAKARG